MIRLLVLLMMLPVMAHGAERQHYRVHYHARLVPDQGVAEAHIAVRQSSKLLVLLDFNAPEQTYSQFHGDGDIRREGDRLIWQVPAGGGTLHYRARVDHQRGGAYDARLTPTWAVARLDDLFPAARIRSESGSYSRATLSLEGPEGWR